MRQLSDENVGQEIPPITNSVLIALNVAVFLFELSVGPRDLGAFFAQWGAVPADIAQFHNLHTLLTSMFLHGGWLHLIGNMAFLALFGDNIEDAMGHWSYLFFYVLCGLAAAATQVLLAPASTVPLVGASGAIAGVMGAYLVLFPTGTIHISIGQGWRSLVFAAPAASLIALWFVQQLLNGFASLGAAASTTGGVAFWAHVGGFVAGALLVRLFKDQEAVERQRAALDAYQAALPPAPAPALAGPANRPR